MIVVDTSALIAILEFEPDAARYADAIAEADPPLVSAATFVEAGIVMQNRYGATGVRRLNELVQLTGITVENVTPQHARLALEAYGAFGKGQGHAAQLNYGDCFSYALAKATGAPLLFKGSDFPKTDIPCAV